MTSGRSRTLTGALSWANAQLVSGELDDFVRDLKAREGGSIAVVGSISIVRQLFLNGLIDTLTLMVHPVIAGAGRHLFAPEDATTRPRRCSEPNVGQSGRPGSGGDCDDS